MWNAFSPWLWVNRSRASPCSRSLAAISCRLSERYVFYRAIPRTTWALEKPIKIFLTGRRWRGVRRTKKNQYRRRGEAWNNKRSTLASFISDISLPRDFLRLFAAWCYRSVAFDPGYTPTNYSLPRAADREQSTSNLIMSLSRYGNSPIFTWSRKRSVMVPARRWTWKLEFSYFSAVPFWTRLLLG